MPPHYKIEAGFTGIIAGIDEAGCGPWAGPVVAAAVIIHKKRLPKGINDSKKTTAEQREDFFDKILGCVHHGIGICSAQEIDRLNILQARLLAMRRALLALPMMPDVAIIDGNRAPDVPCQTHPLVGGDAISMSVAAASIVAKVTRDRMMQDLARQYPGYGWERNAGYGTKSHQEGLAQFGVTPEHRRSFAPIRMLLEQQLESA